MSIYVIQRVEGFQCFWLEQKSISACWTLEVENLSVSGSRTQTQIEQIHSPKRR